MRRLFRLFLGIALLASALMTLHSARQVAANPSLTPVIQRTQDEIVAVTDRQMARLATPARLRALGGP
jgi:hypothetical protein